MSWIFCAAVHAVSLEELQRLKTLTPETFAEYFRDFEFELNERVQSPAKFLARRTGDCDDYATLAAALLAKQGYHPRLIAVFMPKVIHVVCYIPETRTCLDYNLRQSERKTFAVSDRISEIADRVAASFGAKWYCASEFTVLEHHRRFLLTEFPHDRNVLFAGAQSTRKLKTSATQATAKGAVRFAREQKKL